MSLPVQLEFNEDHACFRPVGQLTMPEAIRLGREAIRLAAEENVTRLMIVATGLRGLPVPSTWERFSLAEEWAVVARGVKVAMVCPGELIDPARFGVTVARNRGLMLNVFTGEDEALAWLRESA